MQVSASKQSYVYCEETPTYCSETLITSIGVVELTRQIAEHCLLERHHFQVLQRSFAFAVLQRIIIIFQLPCFGLIFSTHCSILWFICLSCLSSWIPSHSLYVNILWDRGSEAWQVWSLDAFLPTSKAKKLSILSSSVGIFQHFSETCCFSCMLEKWKITYQSLGGTCCLHLTGRC
jgi:hypothetical protein